MAFVDELTITAKAGNGGNGVVRWRHEKGKEFSGPSGGDGGTGGSVYAQAVRDIGILAQYRKKPIFAALDGQAGGKDSRQGSDGADCVIMLPVGSVITSQKTNTPVELLQEGQRVTLLHGGKGGLGNEHFKSSRNTTPRESTSGTAGERDVFFIELRLVVDAGLIGLPNAGKSSLLNALTNASAKVGSYQFTTLEPNLGDFHGYILADIPGLIEGASEGKGLGHLFLRHISRTRLLLHCISLEREDVTNAYATVRNEIVAHDPELVKKREIIILTKTDLVSNDEIKTRIQDMKKTHRDVYSVSVIDDASVKALALDLPALLRREE